MLPNQRCLSTTRSSFTLLSDSRENVRFSFKGPASPPRPMVISAGQALQSDSLWLIPFEHSRRQQQYQGKLQSSCKLVLQQALCFGLSTQCNTLARGFDSKNVLDIYQLLKIEPSKIPTSLIFSPLNIRVHAQGAHQGCAYLVRDASDPADMPGRRQHVHQLSTCRVHRLLCDHWFECCGCFVLT